MRLYRVVKPALLGMLSLALARCASGNLQPPGPLAASGFIEARTHSLAAASGATVDEVLVAVGQAVTEGEALVRLKAPALESAREKARAAVDAAQASLQALKERPRPEEIASARSELDAARARLRQANAALELLRAAYSPLDPPAPEGHAAETAVRAAEAAVSLAQARLALVMAGPAQGEIEVARAALEEAQASLAVLNLQIERLTLTAPLEGRVSQVLVRRGEVVSPGMPVVQVVDTGDLGMTLYVAETDVAKISVGDPVRVTVDAYPGETFHGRVGRIADEAQFTPTIHQSREERVKLVFAVEVKVEDPDGRLQAGMPADAEFGP